MTEAHIVGWGHTKFGRLEGQDLEDLIVAAAQEAIDQSSLLASEIDANFVGNFNSGLVTDGFTSSMALQVDDALRFKPAKRLV